MSRGMKYRPYVRRANGRERSESIRIAIRLAFYQSLGRPFFVLVQRGFRNNVVDVGPDKRSVMQTPLVVKLGRKKFRQWAREIEARNK